MGWVGVGQQRVAAGPYVFIVPECLLCACGALGTLQGWVSQSPAQAVSMEP